MRTRRAWAGLSLFVALAGLRFAETGLAELSAAEPAVISRDEAAARANNADANDAGGLRLAVDRQVEQWLVAARGHLERRESALAAALLARVLNADEDSFVSQNSRTVVARDEAWWLSRRLADDVRSQLEADLDRVASDAWTIVKGSDSRDEIVALAVRHRFSRPGLDALRLLAATQRDLGQHELAAAAWSRVAEHVRATTAQRTAARLVRIESLVAAGRLDEAVRACDAALRAELSSTADRAATIAISGRSVVPREWLASRRQALGEAARQVVALETTRPSSKGASSQRPLSEPARPLTGIDLAPSPHARWSRLTPLPADLSKVIAEAQRDACEQGMVSSLSLRPLVVGSVVIARTMEQLVALDLDSGATLWTKPHAEYAALIERAASPDNPSVQNQIARRTEADSIFGSLTSDGRIVVAVMEPDRKLNPPNRALVPNGPPNGASSHEPQWNRLVAFEVTTGELCWQIGGRPTGPADVYGGLRFLGPPLAVDDLWFGIARREDELNLLAIDSETGHLRWSLALGVLPAHLADAPVQRRVARPITLVDGRLLCPTASGALIAVDPVTRGIAWAARYPVTQLEHSPRPVNGVGSGASVDAWWNAWREVSCLAGDVAEAVPLEAAPFDMDPFEASHLGDANRRRVAVLASPESDALRGIDVANGRVMWSVSRGGAIHLAGLCAGLVLVVEPMAVRAHDLRTGAVRWRCETGEVSGRGTVLGTTLYQPRRSGGAVVIDAQDGSKRAGLPNAEPPLGTLVPCEGGWISQTAPSLVKLTWLAVSREAALAKWTADQSDEGAALDLARLDLHADEPAFARSRLRNIESPSAKYLRREALLALLRSEFTGRDRASLGTELLELCESPDDRLVALHALGEAAARENELVEAVTLFLDGLDLIDATARHSVGEWPADAAGTRFVRRDRAFVGAIERAINTPAVDESAAAGQPLELVLAARLQAARKNSDPFAVQRLVDRLLPLAWGRRTLLSEAAAVRFARTLKKSEPALLTVMQSRDERLATTAAVQLAELFARSGWPVEAEAIARRLRAEHPGVPLDHGPTLSAETLPPDQLSPAQLASRTAQNERRARLLAPPADPWPNVLPTVDVTVNSHNAKDVYYLPVAVEAAPGSLLDRLDVSIDRQGQFVRFAGEGHSGKWTVTLAGPTPPLRSSFAARDQFEAWGVGRLLVLRVGSELFGIAPLDDKGEPPASLVWQLDTALGPSSSSVSEEPVFARVGVRHESLRLIDDFGRVIGRVGPVRPDYLCHQSQGKLVASDTQTGKRLWERRDLPPQCLTFGDESRVYLWRTAERSLTVLSAVDGRTLKEQSWDVSPDDVLMQLDGRTWLTTRMASENIASGSGETGVRLELRDAALDTSRGESPVWSKRFAPKSVPFVLDRDTLGVVEPSGLLHLIAAKSGSALGEPLRVAAVPAQLERIVCHRDAWRWYVAFSGPVERQSLLQSEQLWGGKRMPFLSGPWLAIERVTKSIAWQRTLDHEPLSLAASPLAPVFVQLWRQPLFDDPASKKSEGRLRLIDKRTGREVASRTEALLQPYFVLHPAGSRDMLDIRTQRETIRLRYDVEARPATTGE